jgi:hypothetical protein
MFRKKTEYTYDMSSLAKRDGELVAKISEAGVEIFVRRASTNVGQAQESRSCWLPVKDMTAAEYLIHGLINGLRGDTELRAIWHLFWGMMARESNADWFGENLPGLREFYKNNNML